MTILILKRTPLLGIGLFLFSGCARLASLPYHPEQTPETWLQMQPFINIRAGSVDFVLVQPTSTFFVYLLGIVALGVGLYFLQIRGNYRSRTWWGFALLLWGMGAILAGTSYQAFSYEIKCAGQAICSWTSWWEIFYLLLSAASIDAMLISGAYSSSSGRGRKVLIYYAILNLVIYCVLVIAGTITLNRFLMSFELLLLVTAPTILFLFILNGWRYYKVRDGMDFALMITWMWLGVVIGGYFLYLVLGIKDILWGRGMWFSENDVLHIGLMSWMVYIGLYVARQIKDAPDTVFGLSRVEGS
jgi:hypothetical protein